MKSGERIFCAVFGALLLGIGIYVAVFSTVETVGRYGGAILLIVLGGNSIYSARSGKRPWIFWIGPLP